MKEGIKLALYPFIGTVAMIIAWQLYVDLLEINPVVLPSPLAIYLVSVKEIGLLLSETWPTTLEIIYGFALAVILGVPMAVGIANTKFLNLTFYPILIAVQSVPKVAIAPIVLVWFGTGIESKLVIAFLVAFFPIVVDTATGLNATSRDLLDLARSLRATPFQTFMKVQFPSALPHFFSGAKVAVTLAVIGAVIGEFVGSDAGLGNLLLVTNSQLDSPLAWAALIWLSVLGILLFLAVVLAERLIMPWGVGSQH
jgi:NitT/TauT family transport system permease protein